MVEWGSLQILERWLTASYTCILISIQNVNTPNSLPVHESYCERKFQLLFHCNNLVVAVEVTEEQKHSIQFGLNKVVCSGYILASF